MPGSSRPRHRAAARLGRRLRTEWVDLTRVQRSDRRWPLPLAAALASGGPLLIAAALGHLAWGLPASIGGLVFLHLPRAALGRRMAWLMACAFGMVAAALVGLLTHAAPPLRPVVLGLTAMAAVLVVRLYAAPPPGALFFVMAASIQAYSPVHGVEGAAMQLGLLATGCVGAVAVGFTYALATGTPPPAPPAPAVRAATFDDVVTDAVLVGICIALSLVCANALGLSRPYWVPVSCMAVLQGATLRAVWIRQVHRIAGTAAGLLLFSLLAAAPLGPWPIALAVTALTFIVETLVVRHYGLAAAFFTPLALLLAEAGSLPQEATRELVQARWLDTLVGCLFGLAGGAALHTAGVRDAFGTALRALLLRRGRG